ncbi:MAG: SWIM zinc finger family protein, partial [Nannocystaceae bacterium]
MSQLDPFLPLLQTDALTRAVTPKAFLAGQALFKKKKRVHDLVLGDAEIKGKVKGDSEADHQTRIELGSRGKKLQAHCTCPTFMDGWEKFCQHAVALALTVRQQAEEGAEFSTTNNPWVAESMSGTVRGRRYQIETRRGKWHVKSFDSGSAAAGGRRRRGSTLSPVETLIQSYLDQAIDEDEDNGALVLEPAALAGLLYAAREASISLKGAGRLRFSNDPLVLRVEADADGHAVELHAFLEDTATHRSFEVDGGIVIPGAPTWFLWPESGEAFMVHDTPPWVLEAVAEKPRLVMDTRVDADDMDKLTAQLEAVGVPRHDLFALASDAREVEQILATISGEGERLNVELSARYGNISLQIVGDDPESARYTFTHGKETVAFYRDLDTEAAARKVLTDLKLRWNSAEGAFTARGDDAIEFMVAGIPLLPEEWEKRIPSLPKVRSKSPTSRVSVKNPGGSVLDVEAIVSVDGDDDLLSFHD